MKTWAYIARKGEYWGGVIATCATPKEIAKFMSEFAKDGYDIEGVPDRETYMKLIEGMKPISESPDFVQKKGKSR